MDRKLNFFFAIFVLMSGSMIRRDPTVSILPKRQMIVWNVGQGQWVTIVDAQVCRHFDMGGEISVWSKVQEICQERANFIYLSHWDWDHVRFLPQATRKLASVCVMKWPSGATPQRLAGITQKISTCRRETAPDEIFDTANKKSTNVLLVYDGNETRRLTFIVEKPGNRNHFSHVYWSQGILIPGDSTAVEEKFWSNRVPRSQPTRTLVLGHHGSQSSTGPALLAALKRNSALSSAVGLPPLIAIASSRKARYGHPHTKVVNRLEEAQFPILTTEDWGDIHLQLR